jgi:hypothetical protein
MYTRLVLTYLTRQDITVFDFWGFTPREIAMQLTLHEFSLFKVLEFFFSIYFLLIAYILLRQLNHTSFLALRGRKKMGKRERLIF